MRALGRGHALSLQEDYPQSLVQGKTPHYDRSRRLVRVKSSSVPSRRSVHRTWPEVGLADKREDNGENIRSPMLTAWSYFDSLKAASPQEHGYRRPTWTQELLLVLVLAERSGIHVMTSPQFVGY